MFGFADEPGPIQLSPRRTTKATVSLAWDVIAGKFRHLKKAASGSDFLGCNQLRGGPKEN